MLTHYLSQGTLVTSREAVQCCQAIELELMSHICLCICMPASAGQVRVHLPLSIGPVFEPVVRPVLNRTVVVETVIHAHEGRSQPGGGAGTFSRSGGPAAHPRSRCRQHLGPQLPERPQHAAPQLAGHVREAGAPGDLHEAAAQADGCVSVLRRQRMTPAEALNRRQHCIQAVQ
jgi:hypothetical protein